MCGGGGGGGGQGGGSLSKLTIFLGLSKFSEFFGGIVRIGVRTFL